MCLQPGAAVWGRHVNKGVASQNYAWWETAGGEINLQVHLITYHQKCHTPALLIECNGQRRLSGQTMGKLNYAAPNFHPLVASLVRKYPGDNEEPFVGCWTPTQGYDNSFLAAAEHLIKAERAYGIRPTREHAIRIYVSY